MAARRQAYMYGNTVPKPEALPRRREESQPGQPQKVSKQVRKNRKKAMHMSASYVVFLSAAAIIAVFVCMQYLQLQSEINKRSRNITALQQELAATKEANDTMYNAAVDSVNLEDARNSAVNELGMVYATPEQLIEYDSPSSDYVKQYQDIPENGIIAQSNRTTK